MLSNISYRQIRILIFVKMVVRLFQTLKIKKGTILISVVSETTQKVSMPTMIVTQKQRLEKDEIMKSLEQL